MSQGRHTQIVIMLTPAERATLEGWQRAFLRPTGEVRRGRIILLVASGMPLRQVAERVGISRRFVYKWVRRFVAQGIPGLADTRAGRSGRRKQSGVQA